MSSYGLLSLVASVPLGALAWIATNFVARPVLRAYELRERAWEEILVTANVSMLDGALHEQSGERLRRLAAQAAALDAVWPRGLRFVLTHLRLDLREASAGLLGLANTFGISPDAHGYRIRATAALALPADAIQGHIVVRIPLPTPAGSAAP